MNTSFRLRRDHDLGVDSDTDTQQRDIASSNAAETGGQDLFGPLNAVNVLDSSNACDLLESRLLFPTDVHTDSVLESDGLVTFATSSNFDKEQVLDNSWQQLEQKPVEFFWESGFLVMETVGALQAHWCGTLICIDLLWCLSLLQTLLLMKVLN